MDFNKMRLIEKYKVKTLFLKKHINEIKVSLNLGDIQAHPTFKREIHFIDDLAYVFSEWLKRIEKKKDLKYGETKIFMENQWARIVRSVQAATSLIYVGPHQILPIPKPQQFH